MSIYHENAQITVYGVDYDIDYTVDQVPGYQADYCIESINEVKVQYLLDDFVNTATDNLIEWITEQQRARVYGE